MKKIVSLFQRNYDGDRLVRDEVVPGAEWVINGEGIATVKIDGTCCMVRDGKLFKRYDAKRGKKAPDGFKPAQDPDPVTGHWPGWISVGDGPEDQYHREAFALKVEWEDGTYELTGPKVQGNPYSMNRHVLNKHGSLILVYDPPRTFDGLRQYFRESEIEGIVWHRENGDMVKIKRKDFGFDWPPYRRNK